MNWEAPNPVFEESWMFRANNDADDWVRIDSWAMAVTIVRGDDWQFHIVYGMVRVTAPMEICSEKCTIRLFYLKQSNDVYR